MSPQMRTEIAGYVREVHGEILDVEGTAPSREELMCLAALFAAGDDDGRIIPALQDLAVEAGLIASHVANTLQTRPEPALPEEGEPMLTTRERSRLQELRGLIEAGGGLVDSIDAVSRTNTEYNALMDRCNAACPEDYDGPDMTGKQALAIVDKMEGK